MNVLFNNSSPIYHSVYYDKDKDWRIKDNITIAFNYLAKNGFIKLLKSKAINPKNKNNVCYLKLKEIVKNLSKDKEISLLEASKELKTRICSGDFTDFATEEEIKKFKENNNEQE